MWNSNSEGNSVVPSTLLPSSHSSPTFCKFPQIQFFVQHINSTRYVEKVSKWSNKFKSPSIWNGPLSLLKKSTFSLHWPVLLTHIRQLNVLPLFFWQKFYIWWKSLLMACETYISSPACDLERLLSFYCLSQWLDRTAVSLLSPGVTDSYMLVKLGWAL